MIEEIRAIQSAMAKEVDDVFCESEIVALKTVIRIALEVSDELLGNSAGDADKFEYSLGTIVSGIDAFVVLMHAYHILKDSRSSELDWTQIVITNLIEAIHDWRKKFATETSFLVRCRYLLDLFKLEMALVAMHYG